jgi:hypothetical protein
VQSLKEAKMERQNVTLSLPKILLKKAKTLAIKKDRSLSDLLRETLEEKVKEEAGYQRAKKTQMAFMEKGFNLGTRGKTGLRREELHERQR